VYKNRIKNSVRAGGKSFLFALPKKKGYSLPKIEQSVEIHAPRDRVWEIISDLDSEPEYWYGTSDVRIISKEGDNVFNREITQNFRKHKILQRVYIHPEESSVEIKYLKGLTEGVKTVSIIEKKSDSSLILRAFWDIHFPGIYWLLTPFISRHVRKGTVNALDRIKTAAEATASPKTPSSRL
jgi:hypothetical protein